MPLERLQKILATAGVASRRKAEEIITAGRVSVNGVVVTELGTKADSDSDEISRWHPAQEMRRATLFHAAQTQRLRHDGKRPRRPRHRDGFASQKHRPSLSGRSP